jgi:hypothetical protein
MKLWSRLALVFAAVVFAVGWSTPRSNAAVEMSSGFRQVVPNGSIDDCINKAKTALNNSLQNAFATSQDNWQWLAYGPNDSTGHPTAAASIQCYRVGSGYVVTINCAVERAPNPYTADDLCHRLGATFTGKTATDLATPTPVPTGCTTQTLAGTWTWSDKNNAVFTFNADGSLTDNEGVSGNWNLSGNTVTLTYYGTKTATLSSDGKRISGPDRNFVRKC